MSEFQDDPLGRAFARMEKEVEDGSAEYHWEYDGEQYLLMRNGDAVAYLSRGYVEANPPLKRAIEDCFREPNPH